MYSSLSFIVFISFLRIFFVYILFTIYHIFVKHFLYHLWYNLITVKVNRPNAKGAIRRYNMKRTERYPDTSTFHNYNANPKNKVTTDCVIRALCTAMERPYNEVYEELFKYSLKCGLMLNDPKCYEKYLKEQGWIKHMQPRKADNTKYTGKQFCKWMQDSYEYVIGITQPIIAHIGGHHIVAIIDAKVYDTWDSTNGAIGNYWTKG